MILSASRRTDIPHYYAEWFIRRIREGYALTRNPVNPAQVSRVPLTPDVVDCIVFWSKDPQNLMPYLAEMDDRGYRYYFQFTLTPYGRVLEPGLRGKTQIEDTLIALSRRIGRERVVWRYDPIILNDSLDIAYHKAQFTRLCGKLAPFTDTVTLSFVDCYAKLKTGLIRTITPEETDELGSFIGETARRYELRAVVCCEQADLSRFGIERASCIDRARLETVCGCPLAIGPDRGQRPGCGCVESVDIGAYDTCPAGCVYCYANGRAARREPQQPQAPLLGAPLNGTEKITARKARSHKRLQTTLWDAE